MNFSATWELLLYPDKTNKQTNNQAMNHIKQLSKTECGDVMSS